MRRFVLGIGSTVIFVVGSSCTCPVSESLVRPFFLRLACMVGGGSTPSPCLSAMSFFSSLITFLWLRILSSLVVLFEPTPVEVLESSSSPLYSAAWLCSMASSASSRSLSSSSRSSSTPVSRSYRVSWSIHLARWSATFSHKAITSPSLSSNVTSSAVSSQASFRIFSISTVG